MSGAHPGPGATAVPISLAEASRQAGALVDGVERVVRGRRDAVELLVAAAVAGGHVLVEDVPGSGKTTMAKAFAASAGAPFGRIQATADLLPADITGSGLWDPQVGGFRFVPGPLFAGVVLVDELNRTSARSQSAFMEAMEEGAVTVDGVRHELPQPFVLVATQNPVEQHGTYPLPEGQLDRFTVRLVLGPVPEDVETQIVTEQLRGARPEALSPVLGDGGLVSVQRAATGVHAGGAVVDYALALTRATRTDPRLLLGASTRAAIALVRCAQARALLRGRDHVAPEDVQALAVPVLAHRLQLAGEPSFDARAAPVSMHQERVAAEVFSQVPVPVRR